MQDDLKAPVAAAALIPASSTGYAELDIQDPLPRIPTLIATRLQLELLLQDSSIDLRAVSQVILSDVGATLEVFRAIGQEYPNAKDRPTRIEDCIVSLSTQRWYSAVCASGVLHNGPLMTEWQQCRGVAECARELARHIDGVLPEEAYLVGLLYRLGRFPRLLGWNEGMDSTGENRALGMMLADYWHLPGYVTAAIGEAQDADASSRWTDLLQTAQELAHLADAQTA